MHNTLQLLGASNHTDKERSKLDYYGTCPKTTQSLLDNEKFIKQVWEPCVGHHLMSDVLEANGYDVRKSDIAEYEGYEHELIDFLKYDGNWNGDIITNPPYNLSTDFAVKALDILEPGAKLALFLRLQWLEGNQRYEKIFKNNPPKTIYVFINRQKSDKNDCFDSSSAIAYMWVVWEKGYKQDPVVKWIKN